jgi:hypothetical protein
MLTLQGLVYPLADILGTELTLIVKGSGAQIVTVGPLGLIPLGPDITVPALCSVKASYVSDTPGAMGSGVLMRILGDLYVYACYVTENNTSTVFLLDADKMPMTPQVLSSVNQLKPNEAVRKLLPAVVARYTVCMSTTEWEEEQLDADIVGFGRLSDDQQSNERVVEI